jgi:hypothetical protein
MEIPTEIGFERWGQFRCPREVVDIARRLKKPQLVKLLRQERGVARIGRESITKLLSKFSAWELAIMVADIYQNDLDLLKNVLAAPILVTEELYQEESLKPLVPRTRARVSQVIFLDIDGVLNCRETFKYNAHLPEVIDAKKVLLLYRLVQGSGIKIVISSSWRTNEKDSLLKLRAMLKAYGFDAVNNHVVSQTPIFDDRCRGDEIQAWLNEHPSVKQFVILDDDNDMAHLADHLIQTSFETGLLPEHVERVKAMLPKPKVELEPGVFVFGSNLEGVHGAGAAWFAKRHHGAIMGQGSGRQGNSYAIPTRRCLARGRFKTLPLPRIEKFVNLFIAYAIVHSSELFNVTRIGCGHAGYCDDQIKPFFKKAPANCKLPDGWRDPVTVPW